MKKIIGILAVVLSTSMYAQNTTQTNVVQPTAVVESVTLKVSHSNQLTEEQRNELNSLVKSFEQKQIMIQLDIKEINLKIHREMLEDTPNLKAINNLIDKKSKLISQLEKNVFEVNFKINDVL